MSVNVNTTTNTIVVQNANQTITVVDNENANIVNVTQPLVNVIEVASPGPQGPVGATGPQGLQGVTGAITGSGTVISFASTTVYNEWDAPATGSLTNDLTGAQIGVVQKIYHNHSIAPSTPAGWVLVSGGVYVPGTLNIIYAEWVKGTRVEYWITQ
jgi:hypothetical protein